MGSAATVDPPEGFQLDPPNAMVGRRGKRAPGPLDEDFEVDPVRITAGAVGDVVRGVGNAMSHIYGKMEEAQKDMRLPSQMDTHDLGERAMLAPQIMLPAFARAAGGVVEGIGAAGAKAARNPWTPEMVNHLRALDETFTGKPYANSHIIENFRELHPEYTGTDATIQTMIYRRRNTGVNTDTGAIKSSESSIKNPGETELGAMGGKGSTQPPQITAIRDALMGDEEFEALASKIRDKLEATHAETVGPAHTTYSQSSPRKEDVVRGVKLTYPTSPERLQEIADHAAAWQIYNKRLGGRDFELGVFGGRGSQTADKAALSRAEEMAASGAPREKIWSDTGWFQGKDGKWRYEIDDSASKFNMDALPQSEGRIALASRYAKERGFPGRDVADPRMPREMSDEALAWADANMGKRNVNAVPLRNAMDHEGLYKAYPDIGDVEVSRNTIGQLRGSLLGDQMTVGGGNLLDNAMHGAGPRSTALHETQHFIQGKEGFATGGSTLNAYPADGKGGAWPVYRERVEKILTPSSLEDFTKAAGYDSLAAASADYQKYVADLAKMRKRGLPRELDMSAQQSAAEDWYKSLSGEVEARNVQTRRDMSPEERRAAPPWTTEDIPEAAQRLRFGSGGPQDARLAQQLSPRQMQEMRQLIQKHPEHAEEIRASYGLGMDEAAGPSISATTQGKSTSRALRNEQNAQSSRLPPSSLPENPPMNTGPVAGGSRALSDDMIAEARKRLAAGESVQSVADDFAVHHTTLRDRLERPYSTRTQDEAYRASPRASPLNDDGIRQLILTMKRSGETDATIAHTLRGHMPDEQITTNMVTSQIARMRRRRELEAAGLPVPPELHESNDWKAEVQEGDPGRFAKPRPMPNAMVAPQTRELSGRVSGAADSIDADFPETRTTTRRKTMPGLPPGFVLDDANPNAMVPR